MKVSIEHKAFRDDALAVLRKHGGHLSAAEMLALSAHMVGQIIAMQDQRTMTGDRAMAIVAANIEQGNQEAQAELLSPRGKG